MHFAPTPDSTRQSQGAEAVLIQGELHSFHDRARTLMLPGASSEPVHTFAELAERVSLSDNRYGLMALENSIAGALLPNYLLLERFGLQICGEVYLRISHALLTLPGTSIDEVHTVLSHPMALRQCTKLFEQHPSWRRVEGYDTAGAAQSLAQQAGKHNAAIAPAWCADAYGLRIARAAVEDNPHNWTRFVLVSAHLTTATGANKTSLALSLSHSKGALLAVLRVFAEAELTLTKIQSLPLIGKPWEYRFFIDFEHPQELQLSELLDELHGVTVDLLQLGTYVSGKHLEP